MAVPTLTPGRVAHLLTAALDAADRDRLSGVKKRHLPSVELNELARATLQYLCSRSGKPSPYNGWTEVDSMRSGVHRWWAEELGASLRTRQMDRLRPLREDVYDHLEDQGWIVKGPGQRASIHVSPTGAQGEVEAREPATITDVGSFFGDSETNRKVELAAVGAVIARFAGWGVEDVQRDNCGWDLTFTRGDEVVHAEIKGVKGRMPIILLTRNEYNVAGIDPAWRLFVVTRTLVAPQVIEFDRETALQTATPFAYQLRLPHDLDAC